MVKKLRDVIIKFISSIDAVVAETEKQKRDLHTDPTRNTNYYREQESKIEAVADEATQRIRSEATAAVQVIMENATATIENSIAEPANTILMENLKTMVEASGGTFTPLEISLILENIQGDYWALRYFGRITNDKTDIEKILKEQFSAPDPKYYLDIFNEELSYLIGFVNTYKSISVPGNDNSILQEEILTNGGHWDALTQRLNKNPLFMTAEDFAAPALRPHDRRMLRKEGIKLDVNDKVSREKVILAVRSGNTLKNIVSRCDCWVPVVEEEKRRIEEERQIDLQIKYGRYSMGLEETLSAINKYQLEHGITDDKGNFIRK